MPVRPITSPHAGTDAKPSTAMKSTPKPGWRAGHSLPALALDGVHLLSDGQPLPPAAWKPWRGISPAGYGNWPLHAARQPPAWPLVGHLDVGRYKAILVQKAQRRSVALSRANYRQRFSKRDEAMARAYLSGAYTMAKIGQHFGVHYMTVSRAVRKFEGSGPRH